MTGCAFQWRRAERGTGERSTEGPPADRGFRPQFRLRQRLYVFIRHSQLYKYSRKFRSNPWRYTTKHYQTNITTRHYTVIIHTNILHPIVVLEITLFLNIELMLSLAVAYMHVSVYRTFVKKFSRVFNVAKKSYKISRILNKIQFLWDILLENKQRKREILLFLTD